jgi:hypothetical protein
MAVAAAAAAAAEGGGPMSGIVELFEYLLRAMCNGKRDIPRSI